MRKGYLSHLRRTVIVDDWSPLESMLATISKYTTQKMLEKAGAYATCARNIVLSNPKTIVTAIG